VRWRRPPCPSEFSVTLLVASRCRLGTSSRNPPLVQSSRSSEVLPLLVVQSHFAVDRFPGCVVFLHRTAPPTVKRAVHPLFELRVPPESCPTSPSPPTTVGRLLSWAFVPYSTRGSGGPLAAGTPARYVPPSGFGCPLGGLLPPSPCRLCFTPAALLGFALRSFLLSEGIRRVSAGMHPRAVYSVGNPAAKAMGRPNGPRLLGFHPSGSPWRSDGG
jgi:hypothetical protein